MISRYNPFSLSTEIHGIRMIIRFLFHSENSSGFRNKQGVHRIERIDDEMELKSKFNYSFRFFNRTLTANYRSLSSVIENFKHRNPHS